MSNPKPEENVLLAPSPININTNPIKNDTNDKKPETKPSENKNSETKQPEAKDDKKKDKTPLINNKDDKLILAPTQLINAHVAQIVKSEFEEDDIAYQVDNTYHQRLMDALKKGGILRPKALFDGRDIDITKSEKEQSKDIENKILQDAKEEQKLKEEDLKSRDKALKEQEKKNSKK